MRLAVLCVASFAATTLLAHEKPGQVPIFVRTAQSAGGFTDPSKDRKDSVKDLQQKLIDSKTLGLARTEDAAWAVIEVLDRETKRETNLMGRQNKSTLTVRLVAGEFSSEFEGESGSKGVLKGYGAAAGKVVKQVEEWVSANRAQLEALQATRVASPAVPQPSPTAQP
jgi:hypothetical protein